MGVITDDIGVINGALALFGGGAIYATDEETDLAAQVMAVYQPTVDLGHVLHPWRWTRRTFALDRLAETPANGWRYAYGFPAGALGDVPQKLLPNPRLPDSPLREFLCEDRKIYCDQDALWGAFAARKTPDLWPPDFTFAMLRWLAAEFCVPVTHDSKLAQELRVQAIGEPQENMRGGLMGRAIATEVSGAGGVTPILAVDPLTSARVQGPPGGALAGPWWG